MPSFDHQTDLRDVPDVLRRFRDGADPAELHELLLLARCLFVLGEHGFATADAADIRAFMEPARGLELFETRRRMLARLGTMVPNPAFAVPVAAFRRLGASALRREIHHRTRDKLARLTPRDALRTERRSMPYYAAVRAVFGPPQPDTSHYAPVVERVGQFLDRRPAGRVLDIACAYGLLLGQIAARAQYARLVGTDILSMPGRIVALGHQQPLRPAFFDVVASTSLLEHVPDPEQLVQEMHRVVKPDGLVAAVTTTIHTVFLNANPLSYLAGALSTLWPGILPPHHQLYEPLSPLTLPHRAFTRSQLTRLFQNYFQDVEVCTMHYLHLRKFGLEHWAPKLPLVRDFGGQLVIFARKPHAVRHLVVGR